jgi:hypothetical protein
LASMASTHSSHSVSIESLEDSVADARSNKVMYYACCALVFFYAFADINFHYIFYHVPFMSLSPLALDISTTFIWIDGGTLPLFLSCLAFPEK